MFVMTITDDTTSAEFDMLEAPLSIDQINNDVEVVTLDNNVSTYSRPGTDKRVIGHTWQYLSEDIYEVLAGFRDRQKTLFKYPTVTISNTPIIDMPAKMTLGAKNIIDDCGEVESVNVIFRESGQMPDIGS